MLTTGETANPEASLGDLREVLGALSKFNTAPDGSAVTDKATRSRLESLAIPPAWTDVWISPTPKGHILATGRDERGRKQYIYHPEWNAVRDQRKFDKLLLFGEALPLIRERTDQDLRRHGLIA